MSQFSFFPQADGSDPLADALSQYRRSKKTLGQRSESEESGMQFGRAVAGLLNDLDPLSWVVSPSSVMDDIGDFGTFIDRVKTIETKKQLDSEMASGKLTPQEMLLRQQQIEVLDKMISSDAQQAAAATQEEIAEKGVVGMFGQGVKAGVTQGVVSSMRGFTNLMPVDGDAFWSGAQRETGMATPEDSVSGKIGQAVGSGLFSAASFTVNPYLGTAVMGLQGYGGGIEAYDQAYQYGLTTGDYSQFEKITSGLTSAAIEAATETLGYGIASRLAKTGVSQWFAQPGARAVMGTVGKMYAGEALEEGLVPILQNGVKWTGMTGMQPAEWGEAFSQAATDAFYGGFGGFGAAAVNVPAEIVRRQQTNKLLREAGSKYADESFVEEIAPKRAAALQAMTPEERALESDQAEQSLMQASADLGKAKENVGAVQAQLIAKQQELARARRGRDQARIQALEAEVATGEAGLETARQNAASIAADYAASQFNYLTALASMSSGAPTVQMTVDDVLSSQQYNPATSATTSQKAVEQQLTRLGFKVQYYDGGTQGDTRPAFFSPQTPDTVYLRADGNMKFSEMMGLAMHELTHWVQFNDSGLWSAMRETMDDQTMLAAATKYWQQAAGIDPQVRQSLAQIMAEADGKPISGDDVAQLESRMGRSLVESEGAAQMIENGAAALFRGEAVPGWFGQLVTRMGLRGRSAMSALKLYRGLQEAAKNNKGYTPGKVGFTIDAAQRGLEVMRRARLQAAGAVAAPPATPQPQAAPAPATTPAPAQPAPAAPAAPAAAPAPAPAPTAAAPAPAAPAPSPAAAAPAPAATTRAAIDAALSAFNSAPDQEFFAPSANEVAAAELALEQRASEDAAAGRPNPYEGVTGEEVARLMTYVDAVDGGLLPGQMVTADQRKIAKEMRRKIRRTVGTISARAAAPKSDIGHKREKATGRYVGSPDWVGGNPSQLKKLRKILRGLADEGESGRYWYENSSAAILDIAGGDVVEAEKIVALIALYSPNATVPANTTMALTAYYQFKAGVPINAGFGVADAKATALMAEGKMWSGIKTNSFYQNLMVNIDPSKLDPGVATMDMWMALAFDYGDKALDQGPKYQFSQREIQRLAAELGWEAHQVQAAIWTAMKGRIDPIREQLKEKELEVGIGETYEKVDPKTGKTKVLYRVKKGREYDHFRLAHKMGMEYDLKKEDIEASRYDFSDALRERMVQLSWEATPSTSTGRSIPGIHKAPLDQRREYLEAIYKVLFQNGRSVIAELAGLANGTSMIGYSAWKGDIGAGAQTFTPVATSGTGSKKAIKPEAAANLDLASNMLGFILEQDAVTYHTASYGAAKKDQNMAALQTSRPLTMQEMHSLYKALHDKFGTWDLAPAYRPDGVRIGNFTAFDDSVPTIDNKAFHDGIQEIIESLPDDFGGGSVTATTFMSVGNYLSNNWETNPNGETYLERIQAQRPVVLERVRNLRSSVEAINREFDAKYGWGAGRVFNTAPAPAAPADAAAAEPDVTGERPDDEPEGPGPTPGPGGGQPAVSTASARITPQQDAQYMDAVKRGDMETAQRMVDAAARAAGYIHRVFHGTNGPMFRQFSKDMGGAKTGAESAQLGIFATDNRKVAQSYADNPGMGSMFDLALGGPLSELRKQAYETGRGKELKDAYDASKREYDAAIQRGRARVREDVANSEVIADLKKAGFGSNINSFIDTLSTRELIDGEWLKSPEIVAAEENLSRMEEPLQEFLRDVIVSSIPNRRVLGMYAKMDNPAIYDAGGVTPADFALTPKIQKAMEDGHDGVIFKNLIDPVEPSTHYVVFDPSQFKSSDPFTYDEAGNVIPLSQRFNAASPSIMEARAPSRGIFDVNNPPEPKAGFDRVMAVMDSDGVVYYDTEARMHGDLVDSFPGIEDYVIDGGFIVNGEYRMNMSDGGYAAKEGGDERVAEVKAFTKRVNDPTIVGARSPSLSTFTPEWQEWFRGSKVVDEYGNPKVQFHSTSALVDGESFDQFLPFSHFGTTTAAQDRFSAINVIKGFKSGIPRRGSRTYPVYLSIKNPLRVTDFAATNEATLLSEIMSAQRRGGYLEINVDDIDDVTAAGTYDAVRKAGYDGLVYKNEFEDRGEDSYVIFDPSQAKSIFNVRPTRSPVISSARQSREDLAYQIGRRSGQVAGVARGRQQRETEVREAQREAEARARAVEETRRRAKEQKREQRIRERAKRSALAGRMQARLARLSAEIRRRQRREGERMEDFSRRALREMMREAQTASGEGYRQAKKDLSRLKREAIELINLLPPKTRSRYLPRIAELSSAAGVLKVADSVVRDMTRNEARVTFNRLRALQQQFTSRRGIRNDTRDQAMPLIQSGMAMLGGDRLMGYTDMADMVQRIGAARQLLEEARDLYEQDREAWRDGRAERQQERADAAEVLAKNIESLDELPDSRLWSTGRTAGFVGKFFAANSDIHTLAEIIDGAIDGPIHEMIARLAAGKNAMNLDRRRIDQTMDGLLEQAGYSSVDDYAQRAAGMGGVAATDVMDVMLGGQSRRITSGEAMSLAAMDDDTMALLFDENDPEFAGSPITFLRDGGKLPLRVTRQEVEAIRARLSQGQIALIDGLKAMIDADIRQRAFDVHYAQFGRMPEAIPGYYPRRRLGDSISGDTVDVNATPGNVIMTMLDNAGFTRQRVASRAPLVVDDLVRTIDGHVDQGLRLIHLSDPLRFGITVLRDANVKSAMESRLGAKSNDQMRKLLMNGVGLSGRPTGDFIDNLNSNVSGALLLINPKTWFRQLGGIFRLASEFDMGDWASGSRSSIALTPAQRSAMIDRIEQDSGYFFDRHRRSQVGLFAGIIGDPRQNRERMMVMLRAVGSNLRSAVDEATQANFRSMLEDLNSGRSNVLTILRSFDWALRGIDRQVMLAGYMSARQSLSRTDPAMAEQDAHLAAIALAERAFRRTQNVSDPMDDTVFAAEQKFNKGYGRLLFPFSSDPLKAFNQARRAVANPDARAGTAFGITANILWSAAANPLSVGLAGLATGLWASDDEDDKLLKQAIVNQQAQRAMERAAGDLAGSAFGYGGLILNDVYQAYRAYQDGYAPDAGVQLMPLQVVNESIRNFATGEYGAMAGDIATLAGIPVTTPIESMRRDIARVTPTPEKIRDALLAKKRGSGLTADEERRLKAAQQQVRLNKLQTAE